MAITSKATLRSAVSDWLDRSDITDAQLNIFIDLASSRLGKELRSYVNEDSATVTTNSSGIGTISTGVHQPIKSVWDDTTANVLKYLPIDVLQNIWSTTSGTPKHYTIYGNKIKVAPRVADTFTYIYFKEPDGDSDVALMPDLYLYATLLEAEPFIKNDERIQLWVVAYTTALDKMNSLNISTTDPAGDLKENNNG